MARHRKIIFVLADGAHARLVEHSPDTGDYVTVREIDGDGRIKEVRSWMKTHPTGRAFASGPTTARSAVGSEDPYRQVKDEFMAQVANAAKEMNAQDPHEGVVLIAPKRLLPVLRKQFEPGPKVLNELAKDLTKAPDHDLPAWLSSLELTG
jgi:protein required for attachment to host cells